MIIVPTLFDAALSDIGLPQQTLSKKKAEELFIFFKQHSLFNWNNSNNFCEARADALCLLLEEWDILSYKAWVFSGSYLKNHVGELKQNWKYHVAPLLPVQEEDQIIYYVLDPATGNALQRIEVWAAGITQLPHSYYCMRQAHWYIFPDKNISTAKWNTRNKQNRKWMIQCLAGINSLTAAGTAMLIFNKERIKNTLAAFNRARKERPVLNDR